MSDNLYTNTFDWDTHVIKDPVMGFVIQLHLNEKQKRQINRYDNQQQFRVKSFPSVISLPFINKQNNWTVQIKWNEENKIHTTCGFYIAEQFQNIYMAFVEEAIKRTYLQFNDYDPINFMNESLQPIKTIPPNSYLRWNNFKSKQFLFGKCVAKISNHHNLYQWNLDKVNIYKIQLVNINESILSRTIVLTNSRVDITGNPSAISLYNENQLLWALIEHQNIQLQIQKQKWKQHGEQLNERIVKKISRFLRYKKLNELILEEQCNAEMTATEFDEWICVNCQCNGLKVDRKSNSKNEISLSLGEFKQLFGPKAGEKVVLIKIKDEITKKIKIYKWHYYFNTIDCRYSYLCGKFFMSFKVRGKSPDNDVIAS
eukprot:379826_1